MGSGWSNHSGKFKLGKSDSKTRNKADRSNNSSCHLTSHTQLTADFNDSKNKKKKDLDPDMDATVDNGSTNNNNNINDCSMEANAVNQDSEGSNQSLNTADNMNNTYDNNDKGQCNDSSIDVNVNTSAEGSACNNGDSNSGHSEDPDAEIKQKITQSTSNAVDIKHGTDVKTENENVSENDQISEQVVDSPSDPGVDLANKEANDSPEDGADTIEKDTIETPEHSEVDTSNNIKPFKSDQVSTTSSSVETRSKTEQEPPSLPDNNEPSNAETTKKTAEEKDKNDAVASKTDEHNQETSEYRFNENLQFYRNEIYSKPFPGAKIEEMLEWKGNYLKLERTHSYIQWLFPIPESRGMNYSAQPLQDHEAQAISEDEDLRNKVLEAFKMMLDFYGMEVHLESLTFTRGDNWKDRYEHLNRSIHNHFRITRIIKALGVLGWEQLQKPWLEFMIHEATIKQVLPRLNNDSTLSHFIDGLKEDEDKGKIYHLIADLNDQLRRNTADVNKNVGKNASDSNKNNGINTASDDKGNGSTEVTKEKSVKDGKDELNEEKKNKYHVAGEADVNGNKPDENVDSKGSDKNSSEGEMGKINEKKIVDDDGTKNGSKDVADEGSEDSSFSGNGLTESTKEKSVNAEKIEKANEENENKTPVDGEADTYVNKSVSEENNDSKAKDKTSSGGKLNEIKDMKNINDDDKKNESKDKAYSNVAAGDKVGEGNETRDSAESRELNKVSDLVTESNEEDNVVTDQEGTKANECVPENEEGNTHQTNIGQNNKVGQEASKKKKDTGDEEQKEAEEKSIGKVDKKGVVRGAVKNTAL